MKFHIGALLLHLCCECGNIAVEGPLQGMQGLPNYLDI